MPFLIFFGSCFVVLGATYGFQRELIEKGYVEGSPWDRMLWPYLRRYHDKSLEWKRWAAIAANVLCFACLAWAGSVWNFGR